MNDFERAKLRRQIFGGNSPDNTSKQTLTELFSQKRIEAIKKKSLRRFKARQDLQWERWLEKVAE